MIPLAVIELLTEVLRTINLHLEATPPEQRAVMAQRWNKFWGDVGDRILKPLGYDLPPIPDIPAPKKQEQP